MPIEIKRIAPGLFLNRWQGDVTMADVTQSEQTGVQMLLPGETRVVLVNDLSAVGRFPVDVRALRRVVEANPHVIALLVVDAPSILRMAGEAQAKRIEWVVEFYDTLDDALARGQALLA